MCEFLGLDFVTYSNGFNNLEDIFKWIINSKYFVKYIFAELNRDHMTRAKKRLMYMKFLEYIGLNPLKVNGKPEIRFNIQKQALEYFNKQSILNEIKDRFEFNQVVKSKFSGKNLMERGYQGKQVGEILKCLKNYVEQTFHKNVNQWIYETELDIINQVIEDHILTKFKN